MEFFLVSTFPFSKGDYGKYAVRIYQFGICTSEIFGCQILFLNYRNFRIFNLEGHDDKNLLV